MTKKQLASAGLSSQGRALSLADCLNDDELAKIAATMTPDGKASKETAAACQTVILGYHERLKATVDEEPNEAT